MSEINIVYRYVPSHLVEQPYTESTGFKHILVLFELRNSEQLDVEPVAVHLHILDGSFKLAKSFVDFIQAVRDP